MMSDAVGPNPSSGTEGFAMFACLRRYRRPVDGNMWMCQHLAIRETPFRAVVGPWGARHPAFYTVSVERANPDGSATPCFEATYAVAGLPRGFARRPVAEVVHIDPERNSVVFDLGDQVATFRLPDTEASAIAN
jgi:hypothetical protein